MMRWAALGSFAVCIAGGACAPAAPEAGGDDRTEELLPAGVRRLSAFEYDRAVSDLLGAELSPSERLAPELRQDGFSNNARGAIDPLLAVQLRDAAVELARDAVRDRLLELVPCAAAADATCARRFVVELGARAFRRPLGEDEQARYLAVFDAGAQGGTFGDGVELTLATWLQAPSFLYLTALGAVDAPSEEIELTPHEIAAELAFGLTGAPPDAELRAAADRGAVVTPRERREQALRLLGVSDTRHQFRRFVNEWLEITASGRDTAAFVDRSMIERRGALGALLAGGLELPARAGLLQDASFLAAHSRPSDSAPVLRGLAVVRRVLCRTIPRPSEIDREVTFPPSSSEQTTRQRFAAHTSDAACAACHSAFDAVGFAFENFDPLGQLRASEGAQAVDTRGSVVLEGATFEFADSVELALALAAAPEAERCLARQVSRFLSGGAEPTAEAAFERRAATLGPALRANVIDLFVAYTEREGFARRRRR